MHIRYTDHLVALVATAESASARLAGADPDRRAEVVAASRRDQAYLSARLDGSPLERATATAVDEREAAGRPLVDAAPEVPAERRAGGWAQALKLDAMETQDVAAVEYANLLRCFDAEPELAERVFEEPHDVLASLHGRLCAGLVDPALIAQPRSSAQAVHDGAQGKVIYNAPEPQSLPGLLEQLMTWLGRGSASLPALVVAGIVHERILQWQPFEAGNGRLARALGRVALRARGLDVHGVAVPERLLVADTLGYYGEVAATMRRRGDLRRWLERFAEVVVLALAEAAAAADPYLRVAPPSRAVEAIDDLDERFTVLDYAALVGVSLDRAHQDLRALTLAGAVGPEPGTSGLRFRQRAAPAPGCPPGQY